MDSIILQRVNPGVVSTIKAAKTLDHERPKSPPMGLLSVGTPLAWKDAKKLADHVRSHGTAQFLHTWDRAKDRRGDELFWGDEVLRRGINRCGDMLIVS